MALSEREQVVCGKIAARRGLLVEDLRLHVGTATGGGKAAGLDWTRGVLVERARKLGAEVEVVKGESRPGWMYGSTADTSNTTDGRNPPPSPLPLGGGARITAISRREAGLGGAPLLIAGHLDTVHDPAGSFQELDVSADGKRGVGPGCVDMKGGLVIALAALECLDESGVRLPWTLLLNSDEETGSYHSAKAIFAEAQRVAAAGGVGIAVEPGAKGREGALVTERAGSGQFYFEVTGKAAHVGRDFASGVSAVNALAGIILRVAELADPARDVIVNVGPIEGGTATNVVPERARAWGNMRFPNQEAAEDLDGKLRRIAADADIGAIKVRVEVNIARPAKPPTADVLRLAETARAASEDLGRPLPFAKTAGVCDGNIMQAAGLPTLDTLGVRGGGLHTTDEWIEMDSLVERCQLLAVFMMRAAGPGGSGKSEDGSRK